MNFLNARNESVLTMADVPVSGAERLTNDPPWAERILGWHLDPIARLVFARVMLARSGILEPRHFSGDMESASDVVLVQQLEASGVRINRSGWLSN
jgi:hypothetical protein